MRRAVGAVFVSLLLLRPSTVLATVPSEPVDAVGALVDKALHALTEDPDVRTALHGRTFRQEHAYFPQPADPRFVVVPVVLTPRADDTDVVSIGSAGFTELQYRVDRLHLRVVTGPTAQQASYAVRRIDDTLAIVLPLARARFAELPASRTPNARFQIHATFMMYSGRNDTWHLTFTPVPAAASQSVTIEVDPLAKKVLAVH